jgi:hypothetical protein
MGGLPVLADRSSHFQQCEHNPDYGDVLTDSALVISALRITQVEFRPRSANQTFTTNVRSEFLCGKDRKTRRSSRRCSTFFLIFGPLSRLFLVAFAVHILVQYKTENQYFENVPLASLHLNSNVIFLFDVCNVVGSAAARDLIRVLGSHLQVEAAVDSLNNLSRLHIHRLPKFKERRRPLSLKPFALPRRSRLPVRQLPDDPHVRRRHLRSRQPFILHEPDVQPELLSLERVLHPRLGSLDGGRRPATFGIMCDDVLGEDQFRCASLRLIFEWPFNSGRFREFVAQLDGGSGIRCRPSGPFPVVTSFLCLLRKRPSGLPVVWVDRWQRHLMPSTFQ